MENKPSLPALTGVRAIAAYMVFIHHFNPFSKEVFGERFHSFINQFHIGVTIFFVLSGFLICYNYYEKKINFKEYFIKRFARIYPVFFLLTTVTFFYHYFYFSKGTNIDFRDYLFNITFLKGFFNDLKFTGIAQSWSLTVEEVFYLLAPIMFLLIKKTKIWLFIFPLGFLVISWLASSFLFDKAPLGFMNDFFFVLNYTFFGRATEFFCGIGLAIFFFKNKKQLTFKYFTHLGLFFIIVSLYLLTIFDINKKNYEGEIAITVNNLILPLLGIAPLFLGLIREKTIFSRFLSNSVMVKLGKSSYVFYLIHMGVFVALLNKVSTNLFFHFIVLNCIAFLIYEFFEHPVHLFIKNKFTKN